MSLDLYLYYDVDSGGDLDEWGEPMRHDVFSANITHNLNKMAEAAGIYKALWRPKECGIEHAADMIQVLERGIKKLTKYPSRYKKHDSPNGYGRYEDFVRFCGEALEACKKYPHAKVRASR